MEHKRISLIDVVESFLTGISCLVGGDQLYLFVSQTNASPKTQYYLSLLLVIMTLIVAFVLYDEYFEDFMNAVHLVYVTTLLFLVLILYSRIKSTTIVTLCNIFISIVLTTFVLSCCISYSVNRVLLLTFILGLFGSRLLPTLCWIFIDDLNPDIDTHFSIFALKLYLVRFIICIASIIIKIINNNFGLLINKFRRISYDIGPISSFNFNQFFKSYKIWVITILPIISFFSSTLIYIDSSPILPSSHFNYSTSIKSSFSIIEMVSHFVGITMGIIYPGSVTANPPSFYIINLLLWIIFFIDSSIFSRYGDTIYDFRIYLSPIATPLVLGYLCSYNLGIICVTNLIRTCIYEETFKPCCGDKINNSCYCKNRYVIMNQNDFYSREKSKSKHNMLLNVFYYITKDMDFSNVITYSISKKERFNKFYCSKSYTRFESLEYSKDATNAILILYNNNGDGNVDCKDFKCCTDDCKTVCKNNNGCKCLKLLSIYKLDTITTSSCDDCQLTVRLEAKKVCCCKDNCSGSGDTISCSCNGNKKCCCLAVGCCSTSSGCTAGKCCCVKICHCNNTGTCNENCKCNTTSSSKTRIFFGYKNGDSECCIKELKPNDKPQFEGSLGKQNEFYIGNIFITDCCHVDLQVDLYCYMKNSFYRMTGVNYSMKSMKIAWITFMRDNGECCTTSTQSQCCCINAALVRLCVEYEQEYIYNDEKRKELNKCQLTCKCPACHSNRCGCCTHTGGVKCCCCKTFKRVRSVRSSFYKRMESVRIKITIIMLILFITILMVSIIIVSKNQPKKSKIYDLKSIKSFDKISKVAKKYKINSIESVNKRLNNSNTVSSETAETISKTIVVNKSEDLKNMIKLFSEILDDKSIIKLNNYINKNTDEHIKKSKSNNTNISKDDIMWSYCLGLMYSYVIKMYFKLQKYFFRWEFVWQKEYFNYRNMSNIEIKRIIEKSNYSFSLLTDLNMKEKIPYCISKQRTKSFNNTYDELIRYIDINENEIKNNQEIPNDIDERLKYFIDRWDHRINTINHLFDIDSNVFEWDLFICNYKYILQWFDTFYQYLERAAKEIHLEPKKLNRGKFMFEYITSY